MTIYGHFFLYNLDILVWIQHGILVNMFFSLDPTNTVIKRWCMVLLTIIGKYKFGYHNIIIGFLINVQVQGQHPHQWAPFQVAGLLHAWQISHQISR